MEPESFEEPIMAMLCQNNTNQTMPRFSCDLMGQCKECLMVKTNIGGVKTPF